MNEFLNAIKKRRSIYSISNEAVISDKRLQEIIETAVDHTPSAFNSQTNRVVLLLGDNHKQVWDITLNQLKAVTPPENFGATKEKIASFAAGYGTILYFEEQDTTKGLQDSFPLYADKFPVWAEQASGMLQFVIWTTLALEGMGASLQHYNPLIDDEVTKKLGLPESWRLIAQMPFGKPCADAGEKTFLPIKQKVKVFGSSK